MGVPVRIMARDPFSGKLRAVMEDKNGILGSKTKDEGMTVMKINLRHSVCALALAAGMGFSGGAVQMMAAPLFQDHDQDYSKNKNYQQGVREGQDDRAHSRDHSKKRHFKKDEDQKAYEAGYQKGRGN